MVATMMLVTVYGAYAGHYDKEFQLTMSQRTLMLQTISFLVYLLLGALVYSHIEGWAYLDAVYWADFTLLTVGIGDYSPATHLGRGLLFPFAIGGISK
jgi:potassium channel subfamily K